MSQVRTLQSFENQEYAEAVGSKVLALADTLPENNYWAFSAYTTILPFILRELRCAVQIPQAELTGHIWNYLDGICSVIVGIGQITENESHRPLATSIKGVVNVVSGGGLIGLTAWNFALFGGPGFAAAFGVGFVLSLDETNRNRRRLFDEDYWMTDTVAQIEKLNKLVKELENEIREMEVILEKQRVAASFRKNGEDIPGDETGVFSNWALQHKKERLEQYIKNKQEMEEDLIVRVEAMRSREYQADPNNFIKHEQFSEKMRTMVSPLLKGTNVDLGHFESRLGHAVSRDDYPVLVKKCNTVAHKKKQHKIKLKCEDALLASATDSVVWGMAFAGMVLACIPGMQFPALCVITAASGLYIAKNADKIHSLATSVFSYFHKKLTHSSDPKPENKYPKQILRDANSYETKSIEEEKPKRKRDLENEEDVSNFIDETSDCFEAPARAPRIIRVH